MERIMKAQALGDPRVRGQMPSSKKILEINPRSWIQNQLAHRAGVDLDYVAYLDVSGLSPESCGRQAESHHALSLPQHQRTP
jgi:hypothetical protein